MIEEEYINKFLKFSNEQNFHYGEKAYFSINNGWNDLALRVIQEVNRINSQADNQHKIILNIIKQKYGSMRIHYTLHSFDVHENDDSVNKLVRDFDNFIDNIMKEANMTCEMCGIKKSFFPHDHNDDEDVKNVEIGGWWFNICPPCAKTLNRKYEESAKEI